MKKLSKILCLLVALMLVISACTTTTPTQAPTTAPTEAPTEAKINQDFVDKAADMVYEFFKPDKANNTVNADFSLPTKVKYQDEDVTIAWKIDKGDNLASLENSAQNGYIDVKLNTAAEEGGDIVLKGTVACGSFSKDILFEYVRVTTLDILNAAFALEKGAKLGGTATFTGKIVSVDTPYDAGYKNVTVTITLYDKEVMCYRLKGEGADTIKVNDVITVTGSLKNYNGIVEFDAGCTLDRIDEVGEAPAVVELTTPTEIVNAAYELADGKALDKQYTLTGEITKVDTAYSDQYQNVTVTIAVKGLEDKPIQCFRLKGENADKIKEGDVITVTGLLKNYKGTIEFDAGCNLDAVEFGLSTPEEILTAAYALEQDKALSKAYTLTGKITAVNTAYSDQYKNVTVTIVVEGFDDKPIQCFRLKGEGADKIKEGDVITVTGTLKNYKGTIEFDAGCTLDKVG